MRDIGVNLGSMLPWSAIPVVGLPLAAWMTRRSGYAFWQVLPLRSVTVAGLRRAGIPVRFVEPAWNAITLWGHIQRKLGSEGMPTMWQDPLFFPDPERCEAVFDEIVTTLHPTPIWHHPGFFLPNHLVEIHPGLGLTVGDLVTRAEKLGGWKPYVVDLRHLRKGGFRMWFWEEPQWRDLMAVLLPYAGLIHVQAANAAEWQRFLGSWTVLEEMLQFIRDWGYAGPFVVEYDPRATGPTGLLPWVLAENLRQVREKVEECLV